MSGAFGKLIMFNEGEFQRLPAKKRAVFVYEWLKNLEESLGVLSKADLKASRNEIVSGLNKQLYGDCGPPTRQLLGRCFALFYLNGDQFTAFDTVNACTDIIKGKDDPNANLSVKLAAMATIGTIFEKLGRMVGGSAPETVQILIKAMKNAESQGRCEILLCCQRILSGLGSAASSCHKDIFKAVKTTLVDRSMAVRCAAAECAKELIKHANFTYTTELESLLSICLKALEGSNYDVRVCVSGLLGKLMAATQRPPEGTAPPASAKTRKITMDEMFSLMASGFLRGGIGFLKSSSGELLKTTVPQEVRVGVTQAYVVVFNEMGGTWVERNIGHILTQVLDLLSNSKATQNHVDAVYSRKCVSFVLRTMLGRLLAEKAQVIAGRELCKLVSRQMGKVKQMLQNTRETSSTEIDEAVFGTQHMVICALQEMACLIQDLTTSAGSLVNEQTIEAVLSVLLHSAPACRLNAAWCLRTISVAIPSQLTPLIDRCLKELDTCSSIETLSGFAYTLSALIGGVRHCPLGIPHRKGKLVFGVAEDMLKRTTEDTKWAMPRAKCGWMIMGALMTLGPSTVHHFLPKILGLWASAFPPTPDEARSENTKGDAYTWQVTLECRSGALAALSCFIAHCPALLSDDIIRRVMIPLESCVAMTANLPAVIKRHGSHLKVSAAMIRLRLYETFQLLPPKSYDGLFNAILPELVSEFTLTSNQSMTTSSLLRTMCHKDDSILLGTWLQETDHKSVEDQLQPNSASGSGALEHDYSCLFNYGDKSLSPPGPLPLGVAVIDASIKLFGQIFPHIAQKHRNQLLSHFATCIKSSKAAKAQAVTMNIFTAFLSALRFMGEVKSAFGDRNVRSTADNLVMSALNNSDPILRCAAAEALGRMAQVVDEPAYVAQIAQSIFAKIQGSRDAVSRTGHSIALGCLHRYVGGMGAGQHTQTSVSILLALAQDMSSSIVQVWALHALALIADCGGPMFRSYVEPTLEQVMSLLLSVPPSNTEIHQCLGKCLAALITSIGPELQDTSSSIKDLRSACLVAASVMQNHPDSLVQSEAISCLQQLHIFAPRHVNLSTLVPSLCTNLSSAHLILRRAAVACLRQLSQREAKDVCEHALACKTDTKQSKSTYLVQIGNDGLEGALFGMLDTEVDRGLCSDIQDALTSMLQTLAPDHLTHWLGLCKSVLSAAKSDDKRKTEKGGEGEEDDESGGFGGFSKVEETHPTVSPRWPTRVFASESVQRIMTVCEQKRAHFDLALARELKKDTGKGDFLVMHLAELVRLAFIAATATSDQLKLEGLKTLQEIVRKFSAVQDPDYAGHVILEQFQAQVGAALRPAFAGDTPADVTAMACEVCSTWIASGVSYDLNDVRRIQQLLVTSLSKFGTEQDSSSQLYNESANTMEKLAVLKAWAQVYIVAMKQQTGSSVTRSLPGADEDASEPQEPLISLVSSHIRNLSHYWLGAIKDYGYLSLPPEYASQLPVTGGMFYGPESMNESRSHYQEAWSPILHAAALWLNAEGFANAAEESKNMEKGVLPNAILSVPRTPKSPEDLNRERFHLVLGLCVKALCSTRLTYSPETVTSCVNAVNSLLDSPWARNCLGGDSSRDVSRDEVEGNITTHREHEMLSIELLNVLHRLLLTRDSLASHVVIMGTVAHVVRGARDVLERRRAETGASDGVNLGESEIEPGKSVVFGAMETCMCLLTRYFPSLLTDSQAETSMPSPRLSAHRKGASSDFCQILSTTVSILSLVPDLCTSRAACDILPIVLRLVTCVFEEAACCEIPLVEAGNTVVTPKMPTVVSATLNGLKELVTSRRLQHDEYLKEYIKYFQCCLLTIIQPTKTIDSARRIDDCSVMAAIALFVLSAPREATAVTSLHQDCVLIFVRCVNSTDPKVQLKAIETCSTLFSCPDQDRVVGYIHSVGPHIFALVEQAARKPPSSDIQFMVCQKSIDTVESLVGLAEEERRTEILSLVLPLLVNLLLDSSSLSRATTFSRRLHEFAFQKLLSIGPKYPLPFKTIMAGSPDLKQRLEGAVRSNQAQTVAKTTSQTKPTNTQPKIKLKMDFSNFK